MQAFLQRVYDNGHIYKATYEGLYNVSDEAYVTEGEVTPEDIASGRVMEMKEDNYFFRLSAFARPPARLVRARPRRHPPAGRRNEAAGLVRQGLRDISISRTSIDWGVPVPWDDQHVFYVWYDALINYATAVGYGSDPERFERWWPAVHHLIGKDILRFHCVYWPAMLLAADITDLPRIGVHGWLLIGGEKMSKSKLNQIAPADLVADFGIDGFRYCMLRDNPFGPDSEFSYEGLATRYNTDLANNLGNLLSRVATVVGSSAAASARRPRPTRPLASVAADSLVAATEGWLNLQPSVALEATWRLIRDTNAHLEANEPWKAEPGPAVDAVLGDALEVLRLVALLATPAMPAHRRPDLVPHRPCRGARPTTRCRPRPPGAATPAASPSPGGRRSSPASGTDGPAGARCRAWFDHHCHLDPDGAASPSPAPVAPASSRMLCVGTDRPTTDAAVAVAAAHPGVVWATAGCHPHEARHGWDWLEAAIRCPGVRGAWASAGLDYHYDLSPRAAQRDVFAAQIDAGPARRPAPRDPHPGGVGRDLRPARRRRRPAPHGLPLLHRRRRGGRGLPGPRRAPELQRDRLVPQGRRRARRRRPSARSTGCWSRPIRPTWRRSRTGAGPTSRPGSSTSGAPSPTSGESTSNRCGRDLGHDEPALRAARGELPAEPGRARRRPPRRRRAVTHTRRQLLDLLERHDLRPSRALGQNFVVDPNTVRRIARLAGSGRATGSWRSAPGWAR